MMNVLNIFNPEGEKFAKIEVLDKNTLIPNKITIKVFCEKFWTKKNEEEAKQEITTMLENNISDIKKGISDKTNLLKENLDKIFDPNEHSFHIEIVKDILGFIDSNNKIEAQMMAPKKQLSFEQFLKKSFDDTDTSCYFFPGRKFEYNKEFKVSNDDSMFYHICFSYGVDPHKKRLKLCISIRSWNLPSIDQEKIQKQEKDIYLEKKDEVSQKQIIDDSKKPEQKVIEQEQVVENEKSVLEIIKKLLKLGFFLLCLGLILYFFIIQQYLIDNTQGKIGDHPGDLQQNKSAGIDL